jgi:chitin synthase
VSVAQFGYCDPLLIWFLRYWGVWNGGVYDLTDYFNTISTFQGVSMYQFLDPDIAAVFQQQSGQDISGSLQNVFNQKSVDVVNNNVVCIKNLFYVGETDFRSSARCQVQSYLMLVFSGVIAGTMLLKCISSGTRFFDDFAYSAYSFGRIAALSQTEPGDAG